jgi:hypothetical protein
MLPLPRRRGNRVGIGAIVLGPATLAEWRDELGRHDPWLQAVRQAPPRPVMCSAARLHRHHRPRRQLRQPHGKRLTLELSPFQHMPGAIHLAHRKHALRQVHTQGYSAHGDFLFC